ncbi:MAG: polyprenyl synthetase family protein [Sulfurovaceae bacterium]|nr:polyprenyl synthetase family protein [Sulfurovaceae bacterium]
MLSAVERKIEQYVISLEHPEILAFYHKLPAGKRLRAKLILYIAGDNLQSVKLAAIVEMIHAASLLHDDVIDDAMTRRNKPSLNAIYGNKVAIMLGDVLYSKGFNELSIMDAKIAQIISDAVIKLSIGELDDVMMSKTFNTNKEQYIKMIYGKTASLIEASANAAALLAGKPQDKYRIYGKNLGLAFQMIDDLLDVVSDSATLGKPALHDFEEGKTTLPYMYLYEALDEQEKIRLKSLHGKVLSSNDSAWVQEQIKIYNIPQKCYKEAASLIDEAIKLMQSEGEAKLSAIAKEMIDRDF